MAVASFAELVQHVGHKIECVTYGKDGVTWNAAVECLTCNEVIVDYDATDEESPFEEPSYENVERGIGFVDRWWERKDAARSSTG